MDEKKPPDPPHELHTLPSAGEGHPAGSESHIGLTTTTSADQAAETSPSDSNTNAKHKNWKPRVRFHSAALRNPFTDRSRSVDEEKQVDPSSTGGEDDDADVTKPHTHDHYDYAESASPDAYRIDQPWKQAEGDATHDTKDAQLTAEAEELLRAHRYYHGTEAAGDQAQNATGTDGDHAVSIQPRGGLFYQILQSYRNPDLDYPQEQRQADTPTPINTSSGATTPTRRKWYQTPEKDIRSQETLASLIGASAKLANPAEKVSIPSEPPITRKRPAHKRSTSGKIMSMMGLAQENQTKITVHVAGILQRQKFIIKMCRALILFGAPSHRLEEYLTASAKVLDIECQFLYIPGCMIISFDDLLTHTTEVKIVRTTQGVNLAKLKDLHAIYKEVLHDVINLDEAVTRLDQIMKAKDRWPVWVSVIMYGLASAAVSTFFDARAIDMPVIFVLGTLLGILQLVIAPISKTYSTVFEVSAAILMTFLSRAIASIHGGTVFCFSALAQSSIAMILPGWLVLSSALELHSKAIVPGSIRMVYAVIYSLFLGYGITVGTALYGAIDPNAVTETTCREPLNDYWNFLFVPLYVFFTTFTVQAKWRQMPTMIAIAFAGYIVNFYSSKKFSASAPIAYTFGAFAIGVLANLYSRLRHGVAAAVLLPAVYVQVPGSLASTGAIVGGLRTATELVKSGDSSASVSPVNNAQSQRRRWMRKNLLDLDHTCSHSTASYRIFGPP
ncbi:hypothetical protein F5Y15DRAFT_345316 [Xylariaceae sp. FL0016]|nr:hypothetical protein F5Y15DRAFT_345316 [Xylariaceae sp. FL0016]